MTTMPSTPRERGWAFTPARPEDAERMRALTRSAYQPYVERIGREPAPMSADHDEIAASGGAVLVWHEGRLDGMLVVGLDGDALLVESIAVRPEMQGSGLGSALLGEAERMARERLLERVRLYANEAMVENLAFYRRRGYAETHRAVEDGFARVHLAKPIGG